MAMENILYEVTNRVATITLNRPEKLNALNDPTRHEIMHCLDEARNDDDVRCILLTGSGRAFSSGGDISGAPKTTIADWVDHRETHEAWNERLREYPKPVVGVINGLCYGAALNLAIQLDFMIASDQARFCFIEARMGVSGQSHIVFHIGFQWAKRLFFTGEVIDAHKAESIGLVTEVVPHAQLMARAQDIGERIAAIPKNGVRFNKVSVNGVMHAMGLDMAHRQYQAVTTIGDFLSRDAEAPDGRLLREVREQEGFREFLRVRNSFFDRPWPPKAEE